MTKNKKKKKQEKKKKFKVKCGICYEKHKYKSKKKAKEKGWMCPDCYLWNDENWHCRQCIRDMLTLCGQMIECADCNDRISKKHLKKYIKKKDWTKYQGIMQIKLIRSMKDIVSCPGLDCPMYYWKHLAHSKCKKGVCVECKLKWCIKCNLEWEEGHSKKCVGRIIIPNSVKNSVKNSKYETVQLCPFCKTQSVRISGCPRVNCSGCGKGYCYKCLKNKCCC